MKRKRIARIGLLAAGIVWFGALTCQAQRQIEDLDRGLLAVKTAGGVYLSWRVLGQEYLNTSYNVYRASTLLNAEPLTGASNFTDAGGTTGVEYSVAAVIDGVEQEKSAPVTAWAQNYRNIPLQRPAGGTTPDGSYTYNANDISVGDLDGDGQYELVLKWDPSNSKDNSQSGYTGNVFLDAYEMDGTLLWRIDLGINIRAGAHYTQFMVYDLDGDGKAEVACKTADGTKDGVGTVIGDSSADYRNSSGYILSGPEFLTIFNGETGAAMVTTDYIPPRGSVSSWGDSYGNRVDRFLACIAYLDGQRPSLVMCRGYYTRTVLAAWDWRDGTLTSRWVFDSRPNYTDYEGQGNHNISVADVDEDGKDEIIYGACAIDDDGTPLWNTGLHHGDAMHVSDIDPNRPGLEKWGIHEGTGIGCALLDARTGEIIWHGANGDVGRGVSADLSAAWPGMECWGGTVGLRSATGEYVGSTPSSSNFLVWWDSDDLRELLDGTSVSKYGSGTIFSASYCVSNNGTKSNPGISADLLGDWREEIIFSAVDNHSLRLYVSTYPTVRRLYTLMHDPQYRVSIAWQNVAYNQPPHTGFFLGHGMTPPPPPPTIQAKLKWSGGSAWDLSSKNWLHADSLTAFVDGDDVLFDLSGSNADPISITGALGPSNVSVYAPKDYTFDGPGSLTGTMDLLKAGAGTLTINSDNDFSGKTRIWHGRLLLNGSLQQSPAEVYKDATAAGSGTFGNGLTLHTRGILQVGPGKGAADTLRINTGLITEGEALICFDLSDDSSGLLKPNDVLMVEGDLNLSGKTSFEIQLFDGSLQPGQYALIHYTGSFTGDLDSISCKGLEGFPYKLVDTGSSITLSVIKLRAPSSITWQGGTPNDWDLARHLNWLNNSVPDWFVPGDTVIFNDGGINNNTVNLVGPLNIGQVLVDASGNYTLAGGGYMNGTGELVKNGEGNLSLTGQHMYTGPTRINSGTLQVGELKNGGQPSAIGASQEDPSSLVLDGGELKITGPSSSSNRGMTIGTNGGTLNLSNASGGLILSGTITGTGQLSKIGAGILTLAASNDWSGGLLLKNGTLRLGSEEANLGGLGSGKVTLQNATLEMFDDLNSSTNGCNWNLVVPQGSESWLSLDSRCSLTGSLEGSGILNVRTPFVRSELDGDWSAFAGRIRVNTDNTDATFLPGSQYGFGNAAIELNDNVSMLYVRSADVTIQIGELSGTAGSQLGAGGEGSNTITWVVGGLNTNAEFQGQITNRQFKNSGATASIVKTGTGNWTLSNANTFSGTTEIQGGILTITNTSGYATGSGDVFVRSGGALRGNGSIAGRLTVENQSSVSIGTGSEIDVMTIDNDVEFQPGSFLSVKINPFDKTADKLVVNGHLRLGGILYVNTLDIGAYAPGENYQVLDADSASGSFEMIVPATPGEGLKWDTIWLRDYGYLHIALKGNVGTGEMKDPLNFTIFPNPGSHLIELSVNSIPRPGSEILLKCYDQQGRQVCQQKLIAGGHQATAKVDVGEWTPGIYVFVLELNDQVHIWKFLKQ